MSMIPQANSSRAFDNQATTKARDLYLNLFPTGFDERIEAILGETGVPGYSEGRTCRVGARAGATTTIRSGPGTIGEIFTAIEGSQSEPLMQRLRAFDEEPQAQ